MRILARAVRLPLTVALICVAASLARDLRAQSLVAEPLPDPKFADFHFPESEATLTGWITEISRGASSEIKAAAPHSSHVQPASHAHRPSVHRRALY